jgi:hypothetical protein
MVEKAKITTTTPLHPATSPTKAARDISAQRVRREGDVGPLAIWTVLRVATWLHIYYLPCCDQHGQEPKGIPVLPFNPKGQLVLHFGTSVATCDAGSALVAKQCIVARFQAGLWRDATDTRVCLS